LDKEVTIKF